MRLNPLYNVVDVISHGILPAEESYRRASTYRLVEQRLLRRNYVPLGPVDKYVAVPCRVGLHTHLHHVAEVFLIIPFVVSVYKFELLAKRYADVCVREVSLQVKMYAPRVLCVVLGQFHYVVSVGIYCPVQPHPLPVVETPVGKYGLVYRAQSPVKVVVDYPRLH